MGRTAGAKDGSQRKRRGKTQAEKDATAEAKRKKMAKGTASITALHQYSIEIEFIYVINDKHDRLDDIEPNIPI